MWISKWTKFKFYVLCIVNTKWFTALAIILYLIAAILFGIYFSCAM